MALFPLPADALAPLKAYLVDQLAPISDADSSLLSDYTVALLKAAEASDDEVEEELRTQLRDFLDHNTDAFVRTLFETLRNKSYLPPADTAAAASSSRKRSRSPSAVPRSPPKAPRLQSPALDPRAQPFALPSSLPVRPHNGGSGPSSGAPSGPSSNANTGANGRPPKPCFEFHQMGFCRKGPQCSYDHDPSYTGFIPPPAQVAQQLAMAGLGNHVDYGSIWQGRGPMQFGAMLGFGGMPGMPPFGMPGQFGFPGGPGGPPGGEAGSQQQQQQDGQQGGPMGAGGRPGPPFQGMDFPGGPGGFIPMPGMGGPPMMGNNRPRDGRGGPRNNALPSDASTQPPKSRNGTTLVIMQIPKPNLTVPQVQDYFAKFGSVTNVALDVPSARALVSFATNAEAYKAWKSEDAIFGSRFVKVLWHRPMEGQGARGLQALEKGKVAAAEGGDGGDATMSDASAPPKQTKAEILAKQRLLESQIVQQKVLMARLSAPNLPAVDKAKLMAQFNKLSDEMKAGTGSLALATPTSSTGAGKGQGNRTATFAQPAAEESKAVDGEAKMTDADAPPEEPSADISQTEMLQRKLEMLKAEAALIGVDPNAPSSPGPSTPYNPSARGRGRGRGRGASRGAFRGGFNSYDSPSGPPKSMSLDFRTKSLAVVGDGLTGDSESVGAVTRWYETIGGVANQKVEPDANRIIVTFNSRPLAEKALARGTNITDLSIPTTISWFNAPPSVGAAPAAATPSPAAPTPAPAEEERKGGWDAEEDEDRQRR